MNMLQIHITFRNNKTITHTSWSKDIKQQEKEGYDSKVQSLRDDAENKGYSDLLTI